MKEKKTWKILVVDDSPIVRKLAEVSLQEAGYEVYTASDGEEGLRTAQAVRPDLILVDFIMPKITGSQFCKLAKENEILKDIPIILITGKGESVGQIFSEKYGVLDYLIKPFKSEDLIQKVESKLSKVSEYEIAEKTEPLQEILSEEIVFDLTEEIPSEKDLEITEIPPVTENFEEIQKMESIIPEKTLFEELSSITEEPTKESEELIKPTYDLSNIDKLIEDKFKAFLEKITSVVDTSVETALKKYGLIKDPSFILSGRLDFFKINDIFSLINSNKLTGILSVFVDGVSYEFMFIEGEIVYGMSSLQMQKSFKLLKELSSEEIRRITVETLSDLIKAQHGNFLFEVKQVSDSALFNKIRYKPSEIFTFII